MSFLDTLKANINEIATLKITTAVGDIEQSDTGYKPAADCKIMYSTINLLDGDATTVINPAFLDPAMSALRQYHQTQQDNGREIIKTNIACLKELLSLFEQIDGDNNKQPSAAPTNQ